MSAMPRYQQRVYLVGYRGRADQRSIRGIRHYRGMKAVKRILRDMRALRGTPPTTPDGRRAAPKDGP